jgi:hypothetical protein
MLIFLKYVFEKMWFYLKYIVKNRRWRILMCVAEKTPAELTSNKNKNNGDFRKCKWLYILFTIRRIWRYQRGNQNPYIEEEQNDILMPTFGCVTCKFITGFAIRLTQEEPQVEQEMLTLREHLSSHPVFRGVPVTRSLVLCIFFCRSLFVL